MPEIGKYSPHSGRIMKDDDSVVNLANILDTAVTQYVVGRKTITSTPQSIFAGASKLVGRKGLIVVNLAASGDIDIVNAGGAPGSGYPVGANRDFIPFTFAPDASGATPDILGAANTIAAAIIEWK